MVDPRKLGEPRAIQRCQVCARGKPMFVIAIPKSHLQEGHSHAFEWLVSPQFDFRIVEAP